MKKIIFFILLYYITISIGVVQKGDFKLIRFDSSYYIPIQNQNIYPSFEKQKSWIYINITNCQYQKVSVNHDLSLQVRNKTTIKKLESEIKMLTKTNQWYHSTLPAVLNLYPDKYQNGVFYKIKKFIPKSYNGKKINLYFLSANYVVDIWINNQWVGTHEGGYEPFAFNCSRTLQYGKTNILFIRLDNIPWNNTGYTFQNRHNIVPYKLSDWWNYTGINRDVYLEISAPNSIARLDLKYTIKKNICYIQFYVPLDKLKEDIDVKTKIEIYPAFINPQNTEKLTSDAIMQSTPIYSGNFKNFHLGQKKYNVLKFDNIKLNISSNKNEKKGYIRLWSPQHPNLYVAKIIVKNLKPFFIYTNYYQIGFRQLKKKQSFFYLNNNTAPLFLKGTAYHEEFYPKGRAIAEKDIDKIYTNLRLVKDLNANFLRTAHYPQHPYTYLFTDRMGIAVWEEIPTMWFDGPEFLLQTKERLIPRQMLLEMIYANYNSPSIFFHGFCNESGYQDERRFYLWNMYNIAKKVKKDRFYAQSAVGADAEDNTHRDMDMVGATMYYGVFYGNDPYLSTLESVNKMSTYFPDKPLIATEFGIWSSVGNENEINQIRIATNTYNAFQKSGSMSGIVWWALFDWYTMIGGNETMGLISMDKTYVKSVFPVLQKLYGKSIKQYSIYTMGLKTNQIVKGQLLLNVKIRPFKNIRKVQYAINSVHFQNMNLDNNNYLSSINTTQLSEGPFLLVIRLELSDGEILYKRMPLIVNNQNDPPIVDLNLEQDKIIMDNYSITVSIKDDGILQSCSYKIDDNNYQLLPLKNNVGKIKLNLSGNPNNSQHLFSLKVQDDGKNIKETNIQFIYDNRPAIEIKLPYNLDRIASSNAKGDVSGWGFPSEELPREDTWSISEHGNAKFILHGFKKGENNVVSCMGQYIKIPADKYMSLYIFGYSYWGNQDNEITLYYKDGTEQKKILKLSEWTDGKENFGNIRSVFCSKHYEESGKEGKPSVAFYYVAYMLNKTKKLIGISLPHDTHKHIIAMTLNKNNRRKK